MIPLRQNVWNLVYFEIGKKYFGQIDQDTYWALMREDNMMWLLIREIKNGVLREMRADELS